MPHEQEPGEKHRGADEPGDRAPRAPANVGRLHQGVDEQQHAAGHEEGTEGIEVRQPAGAHALAVEQGEGAQERDRAEGDVYEQHPAPAGSFREQSAEEDAGGAADPRNGCPHAEGGVAVTCAAKRARQRGEGGWRHHGCPDALCEAGADEQRAGVGETAEQGRAGEDDQAGDENAAAAEQVGHAAAEEQEAAVGEDVAIHDPQQALLTEAEVSLDRRQSDVEDRGVEDVHELDDAEQKQDRDAASRRECRRGGCDGSWVIHELGLAFL